MTAGKKKERIEWESETTGGEAESGAIDKIVEAASTVKDKAVSAASTVKDKAADLLPSVPDIKDTASGAFRFATDEQPVVGGLIAIGVGMALGFLLPVLDEEKELLSSVKELAADNLDALEEKVEELTSKLEGKLASTGEDSEDTREDADVQPADVPPLH